MHKRRTTEAICLDLRDFFIWFDRVKNMLQKRGNKGLAFEEAVYIIEF